MWAMAKPQANPEIKGKECYFVERRSKLRAALNKKSTGGKQEYRVVTVSHWLRCGLFSLAEVVAGMEKFFFLLQ